MRRCLLLLLCVLLMGQVILRSSPVYVGTAQTLNLVVGSWDEFNVTLTANTPIQFAIPVVTGTISFRVNTCQNGVGGFTPTFTASSSAAIILRQSPITTTTANACDTEYWSYRNNSNQLVLEQVSLNTQVAGSQKPINQGPAQTGNYGTSGFKITGLPQATVLGDALSYGQAAAGLNGLLGTGTTPTMSGFSIDNRFNVIAYGADPTAATDSYTAVQAAVNAACAAQQSISGAVTNTPTVWAPAGQYFLSKPVIVACAGGSIRVEGAGPSATAFIEKTNGLGHSNGPIFIDTISNIVSSIAPTSATSLATGAGVALNFGGAFWLIDLGQTMKNYGGIGNATPLNGFGQFDMRAFAKTPSAQANGEVIFCSNGAADEQNSSSIKFTGLGPAGSQGGVACMWVDGNLALHCALNLGGTLKTAVSANSAFTTSTTHEVECSYDGTNLREFLDGTVGTTTAATGNTNQRADEDQTIGGNYLYYPLTSPQALWVGQLDSIEVSNVARNTSNYVMDTNKFAGDSHSIILLNGDITVNFPGSSTPFVFGLDRWGTNNLVGSNFGAWNALENIALASGGGGNQFANFSATGEVGILGEIAQNSRYENLGLVGNYSGLLLEHSSFNTRESNLVLATSTFASYMDVDNSGVTAAKDLQLNNCGIFCGIISGSGGSWNHMYTAPQAQTNWSLLVSNCGNGPNSYKFDDVGLDVENGGNSTGVLTVCGANYSFSGGGITSAGTGSPFTVSTTDSHDNIALHFSDMALGFTLPGSGGPSTIFNFEGTYPSNGSAFAQMQNILYSQGGAVVAPYLPQGMSFSNNQKFNVPTSISTSGTTITLPNDTGTGTTLNGLAKYGSSGGTAVGTATSDSNGAIGVVISNAGTAGSSIMQNNGVVLCNFDSTAVVYKDYVQISSATATDCHDAGAAYPSSGQVIGQVNQTGGAGSNPYQVNLSLFNVATSPGGSGTVNTGTGPQLCQYQVGSSTVCGPATVSGAATIAQGGAVSLNQPYAATTYTAHGVLIGEGATNITPTAVGATGAFLYGQTAADPIWSTLLMPNSATQGDLLAATGANSIGSITAVTAGKALVSAGASTLPAYATLGVGGGGTGVTTFTKGDLVAATATNTLGSLAAGAADTLLQGQGATTVPAYVAVNNCATELTYSTSTHTFGCAIPVTTLAGTANQIAVSASTGAVTLSLVGPYTPATYTAHGVLVGEGTSSIVPTAVGGTGSFLYGQSAADPIWSTLTLPNSATTGDILYATGSNAIGNLAAVAAGSALVSNGTAAVPIYSSSPTLTGTLTAATLKATGLTSGGCVQAGAGGTLTTPSSSNCAAGGSGTVSSGTQGFPAYYTGTGTVVGPAAANTAHGVFLTEGTSAPTSTAACGTGTFLYGQGGSADPICSTLTLPNAAVTGDILYATASNAIGRLASIAAGALLVTQGVSTAETWLPDVAAGAVLTSVNATSAPAYSTTPTVTGITTTTVSFNSTAWPLPATVTNGQESWCPTCDPPTNPPSACTHSGLMTGAYVKGENNQWLCVN